MRRSGTLGAVLLLPLSLLAACGTSGSSSSSFETTTYRCALGRSFQVTVRPGDPKVALDAGRNRLLLSRPTAEGEAKTVEKDASVAGQYTNGTVSLVLTGEEATLENVPGGPYDNCRAAGPAEKGGPGTPPIKVD